VRNLGRRVGAGRPCNEATRPPRISQTEPPAAYRGSTITNDVRNTPPTDRRERSLEAAVADTIAPVAELATKAPRGDARGTLGRPGRSARTISSVRRLPRLFLEPAQVAHLS